jgi:hypothetical protein
MLYAVQQRGKGAPLKAYAHVLLAAADLNVIREVKKMATSMELFEIFRDVFGYDEEWEERVRKEEQMKMVKNLLARGVDPIVIAESAGFALDKIQKIAASL